MNIRNFINNLLSKVKKGQNNKELGFIEKGKVNIHSLNGSSINIHPSVVLNSNPIGYHVGMPFETTIIADRPNAYINIAEGTRIHGSYIHAWKGISIGRGVLIAAGTNIIDSNGHTSNIRYARFRRYFRDTAKKIKINDYVWIGMNCTILKGVEIGECSIISSGSVVKDSVPPFCVVEGNPAKVVQQYNPLDALSESYPIEKLRCEEGFYEY